MKFRLTILIILLSNIFLVFSKPVDVRLARLVANNFINNNVKILPYEINQKNLELIFTSKSKGFLNENIKEANYYYVFNISNFGYIIVSADDRVFPVLGYSLEGNYNILMPQHIASWFDRYNKQIRYAIVNDIKATKEVESMWISLQNNYNNHLTDNFTSVEPLINLKWGQSKYYYDLCPFDYKYNDRAVTGCVATAMAMIMKYWNYPAQGQGFHQYNNTKYGSLFANFGATEYNWNQMPEIVQDTNIAVATLMYHCGVSVDMNYGVASTGGSGAWVISEASPTVHNSEYSLKKYFGYKTTLKGKFKEKYTDEQWIDMLKAELDAQRPILYAGANATGGHCFINDGYDQNNFFHINWGWDGQLNGYFYINELVPEINYSFSFEQQAVIGIEPISKDGTEPNVNTIGLKMNNNITPSQLHLNYFEPFTVEASVHNDSEFDFEGDIGLFAYNKYYQLVDTIGIIKDVKIKVDSSQNENMVFSSNNIIPFTPGEYYLHLFYKTKYNDWIIVEDNNNFLNYAQINITYSDSMSLYSNYDSNPNVYSIKQGSPLSVNLNIKNNTQNTFTGKYMLVLLNMNSEVEQIIDIYDEDIGLPAGKSYDDSTLINFYTSSVTVEPATYLLAVFYQVKYQNIIKLLGSQYFPNPIKIIVQGKELELDKFEVNDSLSIATNLVPNFDTDSTMITTEGSNCHLGNDFDYYKIDVPQNWNYTIKPILNDFNYSNNNKSYTLDAVFTYSLDGQNWSDVYDDLIEGDVKVTGGNSIYFHISPYFLGNTGTYQLDLEIKRTPTTGIIELDENSNIDIFPNPSNGMLNIDISKLNEEVSEVSILDAKGTVLYNIKHKFQNINQLDLTSLANGWYNINIKTNKNIYTKKFIIQK